MNVRIRNDLYTKASKIAYLERRSITAQINFWIEAVIKSYYQPTQRRETNEQDRKATSGEH
jgi:hypothetical protein